MNNLYRNIDELSDQDYDDYVFPHIMAMTSEKLHSKAEIAHELGVRDKRISNLEEDILEAIAVIEHSGVDYEEVVAAIRGEI